MRNLKVFDKAWTECTLFPHITLPCLNWRTFWHTHTLSNASGTTGIAAAPPPSFQVAPPTVTHISVPTMSGITKWDCQQCGVRQGVCMYTTTSALSATVNSSDQNEHTWCTNLSHNSLSPHWAHTHTGPSSTSTGTGGSPPPHMLSGSANDPVATRHSSDCARYHHIHNGLQLERSYEE